jgi:hypothetical protein
MNNIFSETHNAELKVEYYFYKHYDIQVNCTNISEMHGLNVPKKYSDEVISCFKKHDIKFEVYPNISKDILGRYNSNSFNFIRIFDYKDQIIRLGDEL